MSETPQAEIDPRRELARRRMEAARAELEAKEAEKRPAAKRRESATRAGGRPTIGSLAPSVHSTVIVHGLLLALLTPLVLVAVTGVYYLLLTLPVAGRVMAMGTGTLAAVMLGYTSVCMLGIIESTTQGQTTLEHAVQGDWRDWFWSLPTTLGMAVVAGACGYALSLLGTGNPWIVVGVALLVMYPVLQLSTLERGAIFAPVSVPILRTLLFQPVAWAVFYAASVALWVGVAALARALWRDPPFVTVAMVGPVLTAALFVYSWMLGVLATWVSAGEVSFSEEA